MKFPFSRFWRSAVVLLVSLQLGPVSLHADDITGGTLILNGQSGSSSTIGVPTSVILSTGGLLKVGAGTQVIPSAVINTDYPILTLENTTGPVITTTSGSTLVIGGGYVGTNSGSVYFGSNTPISLTGAGTLTFNGSLNTFGINSSTLGAGTLTLTAGTIPTVRTISQFSIGATSGSTLNSLPVVVSSVTGVSARILQGTLSVDNTVSFLYLPAVANLAGIPLDLHFANGTSDKFVLQMSYNEGTAALLGDEENLYLGWFDPVSNTWKNAVDSNSDGGTTKRFVQGAYNSTTDFELGTYGVDTATNTVWAVIDHNSTFGVANSEVQPAAPAPEPSTLVLTILGGSAILLRRRRTA